MALFIFITFSFFQNFCLNFINRSFFINWHIGEILKNSEGKEKRFDDQLWLIRSVHYLLQEGKDAYFERSNDWKGVPLPFELAFST